MKYAYVNANADADGKVNAFSDEIFLIVKKNIGADAVKEKKIKDKLNLIFSLSDCIEELTNLHFASDTEYYTVNDNVITICLESGYGDIYILEINISTGCCRLHSQDEFNAFCGDPATVSAVPFFNICLDNSDNFIPSEFTILCSRHLIRQTFSGMSDESRDYQLFPGMCSKCKLLMFKYEVYCNADLARMKKVSACAIPEFIGGYCGVEELDPSQVYNLSESYRKNYYERKDHIYIIPKRTEFSLRIGFCNPLYACLSAAQKIEEIYHRVPHIPYSHYVRERLRGN